MKLNFKLLEGGILPTRAHKADAGFDLYSPEDFIVKNGIDYYDDCIDHINDNNAYCFNASGRSFPFFIPFDKLKSQL